MLARSRFAVPLDRSDVRSSPEETKSRFTISGNPLQKRVSPHLLRKST